MEKDLDLDNDTLKQFEAAEKQKNSLFRSRDELVEKGFSKVTYLRSENAMVTMNFIFYHKLNFKIKII